MNADFAIGSCRYRIKKLARHAVAAASSRLRDVPSGSKPCIRVLSYHRFGHEKFDPVAVHPTAFDKQLQWLKCHMDVLSPARFTALHEGREKLNCDVVLITIDDGHHSVMNLALP